MFWGCFPPLPESQTALAQIPGYPVSYLPIISKQSAPPTPILHPIDNSDLDRNIDVTWSSTEGDQYILQEASTVAFSDARTVYQGTWTSWSPYSGKYPGSYFYRVAATNQFGQSAWSNVCQVTIYPIFVGLSIRWDGTGYIRGSDYYNIGVHETKQCNALTEVDTIQCTGYQWYEPNPLDFSASSWIDYFSPRTGQWKGSNVGDDPSWKWGAPWMLSYTAQFSNGQTVYINGQKFTVTGPHSGTTTYGKAINYWLFVNQEKFLYYDSGGSWTQYVHPGDAVLRYDAGSSKLQIFASVKRTEYYQGGQTSDTVQYIDQLTSATSLPSSPSFTNQGVENDEQVVEKPSKLLKMWEQTPFR